jgi:hypothetical protein
LLTTESSSRVTLICAAAVVGALSVSSTPLSTSLTVLLLRYTSTPSTLRWASLPTVAGAKLVHPVPDAVNAAAAPLVAAVSTIW